MKSKIIQGITIFFFLIIILGMPALMGLGVYKFIQVSGPQIITKGNHIQSTQPSTAIESPIETQVPTRQWHILRIPQTIGQAPGQSGITPENPYQTTLPMFLSNIPIVVGAMYGDNRTTTLSDIIELNKGKDIVISFGDTWCAACLGAIWNFSEFETAYGNDLVKFIAVMENDPERLGKLIKKYSLNPDVIFVSNINNLDNYHQVVLQGYMARPICLHIGPNGKVDRVLISSFGSVENLKRFIGIDLQEVN